MTAKVSNKEFLEAFIKEKKCIFVECDYSCPIYHACRVDQSKRYNLDINYLREEAIKHYLMLYGKEELFEVLL